MTFPHNEPLLSTDSMRWQGEKHQISVAPFYRPDVFQHVQYFRGQVGVLHVRLRQVSLQQTGGRLLGLQGRRLPPDTQDPKTYGFRDMMNGLI